MKKVLFTAAVGALMLTAGGMTATNVEHTEAATKNVAVSNYSQQGNQDNYIASEIALTSLPEYAEVAKKVDLQKHSAQIVKDNLKERVIVFKATNGREQYKSVFIKNQKLLKIIDYREGLIFNKLIGQLIQPIKPSTPSTSGATEQTPEYKKLSTTVNLSNYSVKVVENNNNKRITLYKDAKGHAQYKTIFVKKTGMVKVITL